MGEFPSSPTNTTLFLTRFDVKFYQIWGSCMGHLITNGLVSLELVVSATNDFLRVRCDVESAHPMQWMSESWLCQQINFKVDVITHNQTKFWHMALSSSRVLAGRIEFLWNREKYPCQMAQKTFSISLLTTWTSPGTTHYSHWRHPRMTSSPYNICFFFFPMFAKIVSNIQRWVETLGSS